MKKVISTLVFIASSYCVSIAQCPSQALSIAGPTSVCLGSNAIYCANIKPTTASVSPWTLTINGGTISIPIDPNLNAIIGFTSAGTYTLKYQPQFFGCATPPTASITINVVSSSGPAAPTITGPSAFCNNSPTVFSVPNQPGMTVQWYIIPGTSSISTMVVNGNQATVTATTDGYFGLAAYYNNGSCTGQPGVISSYSSSGTQPISILLGGNSNTCQDLPTSLTAIGGTQDIFSWALSPANAGTISGSNNQNASIQWAIQGTHTITLTATNVCNSTPRTVSKSVTVGPAKPSSPGSITAPNTACTNNPVSLSVASVPNASYYQWTITPSTGFSVSNGNTASPTINFTVAGTYSISAQAGNSYCLGDASSPQTITVLNRPTNPPTISGQTIVCSGSIKTYSVTSQDASFSYQWSMVDMSGNPVPVSIAEFIGSSSGTSVQIKFNSVGNISILSVASNQCGSSFPPTLGIGGIIPITIQDTSTQPSITQITGPTQACLGTSSYGFTSAYQFVSFTYSVSGGGNTYPSYTSGNMRVDWVTPGNYTVNVTGTTACGLTATASLPVTVNSIAKPVATISGNTSVCLNSTQTYTASPANFTYQWNVIGGQIISTLNNTATVNWTAVGAMAIYATPSNGVCQGDLVPYYPNVSASFLSSSLNPSPICSGNSFTYTATSNTFGASLSWTRSATSGISQAASSGTGNINEVLTNTTTSPIDVTYIYTITSGGCSNYQNVVVTVNPAPLSNITTSGATSICQGSSVVLTASAGSGYSWSTGEITQSIIVTTAGSYTVRVAGPNGCFGFSSPTVVTVNPLPAVPSISASTSTTICAGSSVTLTSSAANSYLWSNGATTQSIAANASGNYSVTVSNTSGCSATSVPTTVTVNPLPTVSVSPSSPAICAGSSVGLTASGALTYTWTPSTGLSGTTGASVTANPSATTTYTVTGTGANGCIDTKTVTVTVNSPPTVTVTPATPSICPGGSVSLTASGASTYAWSPTTGLSGTTGAIVTANPSATTTYTVTGTDANGCSGSKNVTVTVNSPPTVTVTPASPSICPGGSVSLTASGASTYAWSPSTGLSGATGTIVTANPSATTTYTVTGTDANGCSGSKNVTVTVNPSPAAPTITASGPIAFCPGGAVTLNSSAGSSYLWSTGATTQSITVSAAGSYTVRVTNAYGCQSPASAPTTVTINPSPATPTITASGPLAFCPGGAVTLNSSAGSSYLWSTGATTQSITVSAAGSYTVRVTNANGCSAISAATSVTVSPVPSSNITISSFCSYSVLSVPAASSYSWSTGATTQSITVTADGNYTATVTNSNGCSSTSTVGVTVANIAGKILASPSTNVCQAGYVYLTAPAGTSPSSYNWSTGGLTQTITVYDAGTYSVTVTSGVCTRTLSIKVTASSPNCVILLKTADEPSTADEPNVEAMTVYPNPASKFLTIALPSRVNEETSVQLFDMVGKGVATAKIPTGAWKVQMPLEQVPPGMYVVKVGLGEHGSGRKVMVVE